MGKDQPAPAPSFEEAMKELEEVVEGLESGEVPLAELVSRYERGTDLLRLCQNQLKEAELRLSKLDAEGERVEAEEPTT